MRNEIAKQIVNCRSGKEGVKRILNGVSPTDGTMGGETPIFAASETLWSDTYGSYARSNSLYDALNHVKVSRMFVQTTQDLEGNTFDTVPRQWLKDSSGIQKKLQEMLLNPVNINTALIYKQLDVAQEDIDDLNDSGEYADFVEWVNYELRKNVEDAIIAYMLGRDVVAPETEEPLLIDTDAIYRFTPDTIDDMFTIVDTYNDNRGLVKCLTELSSSICADRKWLVIHPEALHKALDEMGPTADKYNLAARIGVDYVYDTSLCPNGQAIILDPDEMWLREKNVINTAYPVYDNNKVNMLYEINCGIKPHRASSTALLTDITYE